MTTYRAPGWLPGGHAQTIYPLLIRPDPLPYHRDRWETPDGDFIDLDWNVVPPASNGADTRPLLVLFHGLEGSSVSHYAITLMRAATAIGWSGVVVNFRGCSGESNRLPRAYHSGDSDEIDWILRRLRALCPTRPCYAVGVSLGGNALLKWLGERQAGAGDCLRAAAAISAPLDLTACGHHLARGFNRIYTQYFLRTLKRNATEKLRRYPGLFDERRMSAANSLYEFDDVVTAPLHGFAGADDYWRKASSKPWLTGIRLPTLVLNAQNDPFLPAQALPLARQAAASVRLEFPRQGGHVGFVTGSLPGRLDWLPQRLLHFFQHEV
ncbi:MAG: hydrolase [Candidatus Accumulibacter sp.]|uniref:hydrolase n=1 Tax=Candidatus Accumulibacter TaxID=327159 RepID=UPI002081073C|nr:hydrolase [Accumulibacter sp.]MBK8115720.1 hydrolase [Accumulibacter sp.]MBK8579451.1 hydrolase [Candidatus Accumulibacter propinquus]HOG03675.1 hydrolase [Accumulibacter sp.]